MEESSKQTFADQKQALMDELERPKPKKAVIKQLMQDTFACRQQWIDQDSPMVDEVLAEYPPLRNNKTVSTGYNMHAKVIMSSTYI